MPSIKHLAAVAAIVPVVALGAALPASAAPAVRVAPAGAAAAKPPVTDIKGASAKVAVYSPTKLKVKAVTSTSCSATDYSFAIVNESKASETVTESGMVLGTLKPKEGGTLCAPEAGTYTLGLKGDKSATLTVAAS